LNGDNVVERSTNMPWYQGPPLLYHLEHVVVASDRNMIDARFPVQWVIRPMTDEYHDYRSYAGQVAGGILRKGEEVVVLLSGVRADRRRDERHRRRGDDPRGGGERSDGGREPERHVAPRQRRARRTMGDPRPARCRGLDDRPAFLGQVDHRARPRAASDRRGPA